MVRREPTKIACRNKCDLMQRFKNCFFHKGPLWVQAVWKRMLFCVGYGRVVLDDGFSAFEALLAWYGLVGGILRPCAAVWPDRAQLRAKKRLCPHRGDQLADAHDVHDAFEIIGQHV